MVAARTSISDEELAKHKTRDDIWVAIHGNVYDVTDFIEEVNPIRTVPQNSLTYNCSILGGPKCFWNKPVFKVKGAQSR